MTKSEAKAIQQRANRAYHILAGTSRDLAIPLELLLDPAIVAARDAVYAILAMADVELGGK